MKKRENQGRGRRSWPAGLGNRAATEGRPNSITPESLRAERDRIARQGNKAGAK